jgi:hypothetical protein
MQGKFQLLFAGAACLALSLIATPAQAAAGTALRSAVGAPSELDTMNSNTGVWCADQGGSCYCAAGKEVRYGVLLRMTPWIAHRMMSGVVECDIDTHGTFQFDPAVGVKKSCYCRSGPTKGELEADAQKQIAASEGQTFSCPNGEADYGTDDTSRRTGWRSDFKDNIITCTSKFEGFEADPYPRRAKFCMCRPLPLE